MSSPQKILVAVALWGLASTTLAGSLSLPEVLRLAEQRAPRAQAALAETQAALHESWTAFAWPDPTLSYEWMGMQAGSPRLDGAQATRWELNQTLPFPGRTLLMAMAGRRAAKARVAEADAMRAEAVMLAEAAWWRWQEARLGLDGLEKALKALDSVAAVSERRARFGRLDRMGQVMDAMLRRDRARLGAMRRGREQGLREAKLALAAALGREDAAALNLAEADLEALEKEGLDAELLQRARSQGPALRAAEAEDAAAGLEQAAALSAWLPDLMLMGATETPATMPQMREASFRIGFSLPFVWAWAQGGRSLAAGDRREAVKAQFQATRFEALAAAETASDRVRSSQGALAQLRNEGLGPAQKALDLAVDAYRSGDVGASEVMAAIMGYADTYNELAMLAGQTGMARAELRRLAGPKEDSHEE